MRLKSIRDLSDADPGDVKKALRAIQLIPKIDAMLEDQNLDEHPKELFCFSASDIGTKGGYSLCGKFPMGCSRVLYYRYTGVEPLDHIPPRNRRIFDTGHKVHDQLQGYMARIVADLKTEDFTAEASFDQNSSELANQYEIVSTTDGIWVINLPELKLRFGVEIKSMKSELFMKLSAPSMENVVQSTIYMACLDLPLMVILYYNKNDSNMLEFPLAFDPKIWEAVTKKIDFVREHAVNEEPPPREDGYHCKTCRYQHVCKPPRKSEKKRIHMNRSAFRFGGK